MKTSSTHTIFAENFFRSHAELFGPYLAEAGLDERLLHAPEAEIPIASYIALWEILGRKVEPAIGLHVGIRTDSSMLGAYGHAARCAPTMQLLLRCLSHFIVTFSQATQVQVVDDGKHIMLAYQVTDPAIVERRQDAEFAIGVALSLLREVTQNADLTPVRVDFEHGVAIDPAVYQDVFHCPVHFNQPDNRLYFPQELLKVPVLTADPRLFQALEPFLEQQRKSRVASTDLLGQLGTHIASMLGSGGMNLVLVAKSMGMSPRTLQRRLSAHQVEFGQFVEQVRRSMAQAYVAQANYSFTEIALLLGYAESSSFSRAFRRWTHLTPLQYRKEHQLQES